MRDIYNHYKFMRFKELREYYAMLRRRQKIWYSIPFIVGFIGIMLSSLSIDGVFTAQLVKGFAANLVANKTVDFITWVVFILCTVLLPIEHTDRYLAAPVLMGGFTVIPFALFGVLPLQGVVMVCYFMIAAVLMKPIAEQVLFMKSLEDFPFLERVEMERMEYERTLLYTEKANRTLAKDKMPQKPHEEYDGSQQEELLNTLPKRHIEDFHIKHGEFDNPEDEYTDKLPGADPDKLREDVDFAEPDEGYEDVSRNMGGADEENPDIDDFESHPITYNRP